MKLVLEMEPCNFFSAMPRFGLKLNVEPVLCTGGGTERESFFFNDKVFDCVQEKEILWYFAKKMVNVWSLELPHV